MIGGWTCIMYIARPNLLCYICIRVFTMVYHLITSPKVSGGTSQIATLLKNGVEAKCIQVQGA